MHIWYDSTITKQIISTQSVYNDEIMIYIILQTTRNPPVTVNARGWETWTGHLISCAPSYPSRSRRAKSTPKSSVSSATKATEICWPFYKCNTHFLFDFLATPRIAISYIRHLQTSLDYPPATLPSNYYDTIMTSHSYMEPTTRSPITTSADATAAAMASSSVSSWPPTSSSGGSPKNSTQSNNSSVYYLP